MMRTSGWLAAVAVFLALILVHLYTAPYTKVEESFNVQAVHDILTYGIPFHNASQRLNATYDHMSFPGAVPRTFVGALVLAGLSKPLLWLNDAVDRQILVRTVLGFLNAISLACYCHNVREAFGQAAAVWYMVFQASQFHIIYYASRPLPNTFALVLTNMALALLLPRTGPMQTTLHRTRCAIFLLTVTAIVFRAEVAVMLVCHITYILLKQIARFGRLSHAIPEMQSVFIPAGVLGAVFGICLTVPVDSFFWQAPTYLWPELSAFLSNIFPSHSSLGASAWGTQPWHWYWTNALPRLLMNPFIHLGLWLFAIFMPATLQPTLDLLIPNLAYVASYSLLPHKETRFIFPVLPALTLAGALPASYIWTRRGRTWVYRVISILILVSTLASAVLAHCVLLPLSALSYPGAQALNALHQHASAVRQARATHPSNEIRVHLDNLSTQTGITRFLQRSQATKPEATNWIYDKSDNATNLLNPFWWTQFDYAIMESPQLAIGSWDVIDTVNGLGPLRLLRRHEGGIVESEEKHDRWATGLEQVASDMYGDAGASCASVARRLLREGYGVQWLLGPEWSWTGGWWVEMNWVPKLHVLKQHESLAREEALRLDLS